MPYMQRVRLTSDADLDDNATWRYKLPAIGKYTCIEMRIQCNRYATRTLNTVVYPLESCISKIEVLEAGQRVLLSLTGQQLDAMNYWDLGRPNPRRYRQLAGGGNDVVLYLLFGRDFYDREYGLDLARLNETYLEYTYDLNEGDADYFAANDHDIKLYGWRWMGPGEPDFSALFRSRQLAYWTTSAANNLKTIEIPVGTLIRRIGVQAGTRAKTIGGTFSKLEVQVNNGEYSPVIIQEPMIWCAQEVSEYGLSNIVGGIDYLVSTSEMDLPYWWSYLEDIEATPYAYAGAIDVNVHGITIPARVAAAATGAQEVMFTMRGWGFQKCLRIGFDHEYDGIDLLDARDMGSLDLILTEAAASLAGRVFVQDILRY